MPPQSEYISLESSCLKIKAVNPALLSALADLLESIIDPNSAFKSETIFIHDAGAKSADLEISYQDLSDYFKGATGKYVPVLFEVAGQAFEAAKVKINKEWLAGKIKVAEERLYHSASVVTASRGMASAQILKMGNASFISTYDDQPEQLDSRGNQHLLAKLAANHDQRKAQEAASKDAIARRNAENALTVASALLDESRAKERALIEEIRTLYNEITAKDRKIQNREQQIASLSERLERFASCFDPHHPLHPAEMLQAFECWQALTRNGTHNPSGPGGRGARILVTEWLRDQGETVDIGAKIKRFEAIVGWRGKGSGAIRSKK